ncbi:hypothetical protein, partial [Catellatospora sp. NPDC049609]|uniref:hypothetical protein n=1 Tax=Catellatospora sp. NPDC049609 TaxID=3155505 RepID=UPI0034338935
MDGSAGTVRPEWPQGGSAAAPRNFRDPQGRALVKDESLPVVTAGAVGYRAVGVNLSTRFEYLGATSLPWWWLAKHSDGTTSYFGDKGDHPYSFAPLVRVSEPNGFDDPAELKYTYATVGRTTAAPTGSQPREFVLTAIDYETQSSEQAYARVEFSWADPAFCGSPATMPAVGSRLDYRLGFARLSGTRKLTQVTTKTKKTVGSGFDTRSVYALGYNAATESCTGSEAVERGAPYRELASVQHTVYRPGVAGQDGPVETVLPPTRFTYGKAASYAKDAHYGPAVPLKADLPSGPDVPVLLPESVDTNQFFHRDPSDANAFRFTPVAPVATCPDPLCPIPAGSTDLRTDSKSWMLATGQATGESVARLYVDIDGDNRVDLLERQGGLPKLAAAAPQTGGCTVDVYLNTGTKFVKQTGADAATSKFKAFSLRKAMGDIPVGSGVPESGAGELLCSLSRSLSKDASGGLRGDAGTACTADNAWLAPASWGSMQQAKHAFMDMDGDGRPELVTQTIASVDCPYASTQGIPAPTYRPSLSEEFGNPDPHWRYEYVDATVNPNVPEGGEGEPVRAITKRQRYLWVYRNTGSGFAATPTRVQVPNPTEQAGPNLVAPGASVMGGFFAPNGGRNAEATLSDVNGDGYQDVVYESGDHSAGRSRVSLGSPGGSFKQPFQLPDGDQNLHLGQLRSRIERVTDPNGPTDPALDNAGAYTGYLREGLGPDINADGLPDKVEVQWEGAPFDFDPNGTRVNFNTGYGFATAADDGEVMFGEDGDNGAGSDTNFLDSFRAPDLTGKNWQHYPPLTERSGKTRMLDMDHDGLPDLLFYDREAGRAKLYAGGGRQWVSSHDADTSVAQHLAGVIKGFGTTYGGTTQEFDDRADYRYAAIHQAVDVNADGLLDLLSDPEGDGVSVRYAKSEVGSGDTFAPARLLRTVSNGTGGKTTVSYTRDAAAGKWLATTVTADPGHGQPAITSEHSYIRPVFVADLYGRKAFRGFEETHTRLNASTPGVADDVTHVTMYSYQVQPGGVPILSATVLGHLVDGAGIGNTQPGVMSIVEPSYHLRSLPGGLEIPGARADYPTRTVLPSMTVSRTCTGTGGQIFDACRDNAPSVTSETTWVSKSVGGEYVMELPSVSETRFVNGEGKDEVRRSTPTFNVYWEAGGFRVAPDKTVDAAVVDGTYKALGEVRYTYDTVDFSRVQTVTVDDAAAGVPDKTSR